MTEPHRYLPEPAVVLQVQTYRNQPPATPLYARIGAAGGTLGRAADNDLVLDDPGKMISRVHARVHWRDGRFYLSDAGVNPSIVDDRPLGQGAEAALDDGTRLLVGDYLILALLEAAPDSAGADATVFRTAPPAPAALSAPAAPAVQALAPLPLFEPPPPAPPAAPLPPFEPPVAQAAPAMRDTGPTDALAGARILEGFDGVDDPSAAADPLGLNLFAPAAPAPAGAGPAGADYVAPAYRGAESDHAAPQAHVFALPAPVAIPDDYDPLADSHAASPPAPPVQAYAPVAPAAVPIQPAPVAPAPAPAPAPAALHANAPASDAAVLAALLDGLGVPGLRPAGDPEALAREVGRMLRAAVGGTIDVLMARALTKRESRIDMTMIAARANNPLKFFPDADSALTQMLGARLPGYLAPLDAFVGAFDDLRAHELAVIAGTRAALAAVTQRFDPARIEARVAAPGQLDRLFPTARKARLWERLVEMYADLARDADEDLQRLFSEKFSKAYDEQVERLHRERQSPNE
jgi:type VI secretion system protein